MSLITILNSTRKKSHRITSILSYTVETETKMFNALNRFISRLDGDTPSAKDRDHGGFGFQVLRNTNLDLSIDPWFDFVVGINGRMIVRMDAILES